MARILVIDDEDDSRALVSQGLESERHGVITATDGAQGLALQRQRPADLVITDIFMPEPDGLETIHALKKDFPGLKVIAMSGGGRASRALDSCWTPVRAA